MKSTNGFAAIAADLPRRARALVEQTVEAVETGAKAHSRVKTGNMRDHWVHAMTGETSGEVSNDVPYTPTHEYGSVKIPAQPMLHPAMDEARPDFEAGLARLLEP